MTRALLQWSDVRPTRLQAVGRSGIEYQIARRMDCDDGRWALYRFDSIYDDGQRVSEGWLADMKALAEEHERDALGPPPAPQRIAWEKLKPGRYMGRAPCGTTYRILKVGDIWQLELLARFGGPGGTPLDEGSLAAMKAAAARHATEAARTRPSAEVPT
ncbi:MAG: hypothetical protein AB7S70_14500 [Hyphomicrobium sp.]|uniref:hypothetical protein n=1 Tax=Hyphomicrobium sp. TaxID=82 RepID=UPI003D10A7DA